jgi:hypothetical protein
MVGSAEPAESGVASASTQEDTLIGEVLWKTRSIARKRVSSVSRNSSVMIAGALV